MIWFIPPPGSLTAQAWHLFAIFASTIFSVVIGAFPILTASVLAVAAAVLTGTLTADEAYDSFANPTIVLIIVAFLVARAVVKCGLGERLGYRAISWFGKLGARALVQHLRASTRVISPAFPSNTARSGVLYRSCSRWPRRQGRRRSARTEDAWARFLMFSGMASLTLSSALWLTAMAGNPLGAEIAEKERRQDRLRFVAGGRRPCRRSSRWSSCRSLLYKIIKPEVTAMPEAPATHASALAALGPLTRDQKVVGSHVPRHGGALGAQRDARASIDGRGVTRARGCC